jgi:pilus assembly protein Flp/PilA
MQISHVPAKSLTMNLIVRFLKDESAATAIEYGLIAAGIAVAVIPVITGLGTKLKTTFSTIETALK